MNLKKLQKKIRESQPDVIFKLPKRYKAMRKIIRIENGDNFDRDFYIRCHGTMRGKKKCATKGGDSQMWVKLGLV